MSNGQHDHECDDRYHQSKEQSKQEGASDHYETGARTGRPNPGTRRPAGGRARAHLCDKAVGRDRMLNLFDCRGGLNARDASR